MNFNFGIDTSILPKNQNDVIEDILVATKSNNSKHHILLLLENKPDKSGPFKTFIINLFKVYLPEYDYDVVIASKLNMGIEHIKKHGVYKYYQQNHSDFLSYVRDNTVVLTSGYALQAVTQSDNLSIDCFYDYVFNNTYFYSPRTLTYILPFDSFLSVIIKWDNTGYALKQCSRVEFMKLQFQCIKDNPSLFTKPKLDRYIIKKVNNNDDWDAFILASKKYNKISLDLETTGLNFIRDKIICMTVSFDGKTGYYVPWLNVNKKELSMMLKDKYQIGANKKFDDKFLIQNGITNVYTDSDVLQLGHLLNEMRFNGLKSLVYHYTHNGGYDDALEEYKRKYNPETYADIPEDILMQYATMDAILTFNIEARMQEQLTKLDNDFPPKRGWWEVRRLYEEVIIPYQNLFTQIEYDGFNVNVEKLKSNSLILQADILSLKDRLRKALNLTMNMEDLFGDAIVEKDELDSSKKLGEILERLNWECLGRTKGGWYKTGDAELERWLQLGHGEAALIQEMRSLLTLQKTFMGIPDRNDKGWIPHITRHQDGSDRVHSTYSVMLMDTYRNGCQIPNYQQLPSSSMSAELFKQVVTVPDTKKQYLVSLDYSGFQLRLATIDSKDIVLMNAYKENPDADIHSKTAFNIFCSDVKFNINEIHIDDNGKKRVYLNTDIVRIIRDGKKIKVKASEIIETDEFQ